jgi:hypothetical protein
LKLGFGEFPITGGHPTGTYLIGELAPLLSALGHEMHKRHKSAGVFWPNLDAVLLCSVSFSSPLSSSQPVMNS